MKIKKIDFDFDFNELENIDDNFIDVNVTLDNERTYIVQLITNKCLLSLMEEDKRDFIYPGTPSIIVKELTIKTIEATIKHYVEEDNGYWLKFCHMGTEIDDKTLDILTDRWFAKTQWRNEVFEYDTPGNPNKYSLIDFTVTNDSNSKIESESLASIKFKAKLKAELKAELKEELRIEFQQEFGKIN